MPGLVTAQPLRREDRSHAQGVCDRAWRGPDRSGRAAAPKAGLTRRDLARHQNGRSAGERFPPVWERAFPFAQLATDGGGMIPPERRAILGPLAGSLPRGALDRAWSRIEAAAMRT